ncbi:MULTISPECIES: pentapeptide repeat-containing protein [unclassified Francisella]|uniref:pentapeptide repeat-containing protein n=1 Tax=unclassified Francisella TaxID=2610885 RepID=UPI002E303B92|nr:MULTISPECIES: pentapeptide repeat-containing protein [unclassified Francisella]MED7818334.1 pentapeptide repeat-containing protein [Francisella sp. 19S2-4]MED7829170.1 pentapeptide repeat-containing protein [Francisella sp. 19S2-10]
MKVEVPNHFLFAKKTTWDKKKFFLNISIYSGFYLDSNKWLDKQDLSDILKYFTENNVIFDNGILRKYQEYFIYCDDQNIESYSFKILESEKSALKQDFLPLNPDSESYEKPKGTFDKKWLFEKWPALPDDCDKTAFQLAPKDQQLEDELKWGESFYIKDDYDTEYRAYSLPAKKLQAFYKEINTDKNKELDLKADVLWVFPTKNIALVISHGQLDVLDQENSNIESISIVDPYEQEKPSKVEKKLDIKKPEIKEKITKPKVKVSPDIAEAKKKAEQKIAEVKSKYGEYIEKHKSYKPPQEIQDIIDGKTQGKSISEAIKGFVDKKISDLNNKVSNVDLYKKISEVQNANTSIKQSAARLPQMISEQLEKLKAILPKDKLKEIPEDDLKKSADRIAKMILDSEYKSEKVEAENEVDKNCVGRDFSNQDLRSYDFSDCDLTDAKFENARLEGTIFDRSIIDKTSFRDAKLTDVSFENLSILSSDFSNSICENLNLKSVSIRESKFTGSNITNAKFENVIIKQTNLSNLTAYKFFINTCSFDDCNISLAELSQCSVELSVFNKVVFNKVNAEKIILNNSNFTNSNIEFINIPSSFLDGVSFSSTKLLYSNLRGASLKKINIRKSFLTDVDFSEAIVSGFQVNDSEIINSNFEQINFHQGIKVSNSTFKDNTLESVEMNSSIFKKCDLTEQRFNKVLAKKIIFSKCNLSGCLVENSNLLKANFYQSNLSKAVFTESNLYEANFYQAKLGQTIFDRNLVKSNFETAKDAQSVREIDESRTE